jgi:hypothetical protein
VCTFTGNTASGNNEIDNWIATNMASPPPTCPPYLYADVRCPLIGLLPVLSTTQLGTGSSGTVQVVNFTVFEIVGLTQDKNGTGQQYIVGQFLKMAAAVGPTRLPDPSGQLNGPLMIRLVQ